MKLIHLHKWHNVEPHWLVCGVPFIEEDINFKIYAGILVKINSEPMTFSWLFMSKFPYKHISEFSPNSTNTKYVP